MFLSAVAAFVIRGEGCHPGKRVTVGLHWDWHYWWGLRSWEHPLHSVFEMFFLR